MQAKKRRAAHGGRRASVVSGTRNPCPASSRTMDVRPTGVRARPRFLVLRFSSYPHRTGNCLPPGPRFICRLRLPPHYYYRPTQRICVWAQEDHALAIEGAQGRRRAATRRRRIRRMKGILPSRKPRLTAIILPAVITPHPLATGNLPTPGLRRDARPEAPPSRSCGGG